VTDSVNAASKVDEAVTIFEEKVRKRYARREVTSGKGRVTG
jgi:hypothetical protein